MVKHILARILVLTAYTQKPLINAHADVSSWARCLFGLSFPHPSFVYASSECSGECVHMRRHA